MSPEGAPTKVRGLGGVVQILTWAVWGCTQGMDTILASKTANWFVILKRLFHCLATAPNRISQGIDFFYEKALATQANKNNNNYFRQVAFVLFTT